MNIAFLNFSALKSSVTTASFRKGVLICLVALLAPWTAANAAAPVLMWGAPNAQNVIEFFQTPEAACTTQGPKRYPQWTTGWSAVYFNAQQYRCTRAGDPWFSASSANRCADGTAPQPGKPTNEQCADPAPACPAAGTAAGTYNFTTGWQNSSSLVDQVAAFPQTAPPVTVVVDGCQLTRGALQACYVSNQPSATGLYRLSCDFNMTYNGEPGTVSPATPDPNAPSAAPPCPGSYGTVNGVATCLLGSGGSPVEHGKPPVAGNPVPGNPDAPATAQPPKSFDPSTGGGSGSPSGSQGAGGEGSGPTVPNSNGSNSGNGNGTGSPTNVVVNVPDTMKINETGTPNGSDSGVKDADVKKITDDRIGEMGKKRESLGFNWKLELPSGTCEPWTISILGVTEVFNWCPRLQRLRDLIGWVYVFMTMIAIYQSGINAVKFNGGK